jgi:hypothetical protein
VPIDTVGGVSTSPTSPPVSCTVCGVTADPADTLSWLREYDRRRGPTLICPACARQHLRAIEAKLDQEYW